MKNINQTPQPPYYAVRCTSLKSGHLENYAEEALRMENLVKSQPGYLGHESASADIGITVSYWKDLKSIEAWKKQKDHRLAQIQGKSSWYRQYKVRICKVEKEYGM